MDEKLAKLIEDVVTDAEARKIPPNTAYTRVAKEVFAQVRSGQMEKEEADEILMKLEKDLKFSDKVFFHGTSALIENF
jgi:hypothetical protein